MQQQPVTKLLNKSLGDKNVNIVEIGNLKYKIIKKIGQGKFGDVYKAIDLSKNQEVAVKMIKINENFTKKEFFNEA